MKNTKRTARPVLLVGFPCMFRNAEGVAQRATFLGFDCGDARVQPVGSRISFFVAQSAIWPVAS